MKEVFKIFMAIVIAASVLILCDCSCLDRKPEYRMQFIAEPLNQADKDKSFRVTINYPNGDTRRYVANGSFRMTYSPCTKGDEFYIYTDKYDTEEEFDCIVRIVQTQIGNKNNTLEARSVNSLKYWIGEYD